MEKLSPMGSGPFIGAAIIPYLAATIVLTVLFPELFKVQVLPFTLFLVLGIIITLAGLAFYVATGRALLKGLKNNELITTGPYAWSQNPLYASFIVFIIPGISFMTRSWLILTTCIVGYLVFKLTIHREYEQCERIFGEAYTAYRKKTSELIPFPQKRNVT